MIALVYVALVEWMNDTMGCRIDSLTNGEASAAPGGYDNGNTIRKSSNKGNICGENGKWMENGNLCFCTDVPGVPVRGVESK